MALERQSIEKKDFPIGRRGYDPEAVDAHLRALADEVDDLKRSSRRRTETLASSASEQVRAIVEAAETSAAAIQHEAEEEARAIRAEATSEADAARDQANQQAREYVGRVSEATAVMLQRIDAMEGELGALIESLKTGSNRLNADLQLLETNLNEVREATEPHWRFEPEAGASSLPVPETPPPLSEPPISEESPFADESPAAEPDLGAGTGFGAETDFGAGAGFGTGSEFGAGVADEPFEAEPDPFASSAEPALPSEPSLGEPAAYEPPIGGEPAVEPPLPEPEPLGAEPAGAEPLDEPAHRPVEPLGEPKLVPEVEPAGAAPGDGSDDTEGARLIALNMALNGTPREETDRYLAENFNLRDRDTLLDEVYASVEG